MVITYFFTYFFSVYRNFVPLLKCKRSPQKTCNWEAASRAPHLIGMQAPSLRA
jgi:hypothetical protein